ncbi:MAG: ASCH domain-containing protein [Clostridia bacterium]|nr:ASCH domain-containing protein [Clostridia bacterium]
MTHKMKLQTSPFYSIKSGTKTVEMRLYDEKRQLIKVGDEIEFTLFNGTDTIYCVVEGINRFSDFSQLYKHYDKSALGYTDTQVASPSDMSQYYKDEDIKRYGVVAIEIKLK